MTTANLPPWDPDEYDRQVKAGRAREKQERGRKPTSAVQPAVNTFNYDGKAPRGHVTDAEQRRREAAARAMRQRAEHEAGAPQARAARSAARARRPGRVRQPTPKQKPNGRWLARCTADGIAYGATFDTKQEAQAYLDSITNQGDD